MSELVETGLDISGVDFGDINLLDSTVFAERVPHEWFAFLRQNGYYIPDPATGGSQAGTLLVDFRFLGNLDAGETVVLARTSTPKLAVTGHRLTFRDPGGDASNPSSQGGQIW